MADLLAYGEDIIGFPGGEATAKVKLMTKLWENPDPTQAMASDTEISINDTNYDLLAYICLLKSTNNKVIPVVITPKNKDAYVCYADAVNNLQRRFDYTNGTITAKTGYIGSTVDNTCIILYQIYGIKLEQEIPVVAENVSTLAANCLLSDGETSVEDRIDEMEKHSYGGASSLTIITSYTDIENPYIVPTDGYVRVTNGNVRLRSISQSESVGLISSSETASVFVRKGMPIYIVTSSSGTTSAYFIPLS